VSFLEFLIAMSVAFVMIMGGVAGVAWWIEGLHAQWQDRRMHAWQSRLELRDEMAEEREENLSLREFVMDGREAEFARRAASFRGSLIAATELIGDDTVIMDLDWINMNEGVRGEDVS
jgi:hypothetical protein